MHKSEIILSVFYNGQFFTALFERNDEKGYSVSQKNFVVCPSDNEMLALIKEGYYLLSFSAPSGQESGEIIKLAQNPKKRQREAAKASGSICASTKAQQAIKLQHDERRMLSKSASKEDEKRIADKKYELRALKKKLKHKGR
jgi:hypothetical protein